MNKERLPDGWEWKQIKDFLKRVDLIDPTKEPDKQFYYIDIDSIDNSNQIIRDPKLITGKEAPSRARQVVKQSDILFSTVRPYLKNIALVDGIYDGQVASTGFSVIRVTEGVDNKYLFYYLKSDGFLNELKRYYRGANYPAISDSNLFHQEFPLPPLDTQRKIVAILDKAEATQRLRAEADALMQQLLQSVFLEMFGDPVANPMGWETCKLSALSKNLPNNGIFVKNDMYGTGNAQVIWISDFINNMYVNTDCLKQISASDDDLKKYKVQYGDVLFCRSSLNYEGVGKASCVPKSTPDHTLFECHIIKLSLKTENILPEFFQMQSTLPYFRHQIFKHAKTATMTTISQSGVTGCWVIVPPIQLQKKFVNIVSKVMDLKAYQKISLFNGSELFDSLQLKAFTGELVP